MPPPPVNPTSLASKLPKRLARRDAGYVGWNRDGSVACFYLPVARDGASIGCDRQNAYRLVEDL